MRVKSIYTGLEYEVLRDELDSYVVTAVDGTELQVLKEMFDVMQDKTPGTNPKDIIGATKPDLSLVPSALIIQVAEAMKNGADKYGAYNWREKQVQVMTYIAAAQRHILQYLDGEEYATDSGVHHLAHAAACFGIVLDALATENLVDNRPTAGAASRLIADLTKGGK